jgi:hypothetical protein
MTFVSSDEMTECSMYRFLLDWSLCIADVV